MATVRRQNPVHLPSLGSSGHRSIDEADLEALELRVELKCSNEVGGKREFVFVACSGVEYLRDKLAHGWPVVAQEVVHLRQNEPRKKDPACRR